MSIVFLTKALWVRIGKKHSNRATCDWLQNCRGHSIYTSGGVTMLVPTIPYQLGKCGIIPELISSTMISFLISTVFYSNFLSIVPDKNNTIFKSFKGWIIMNNYYGKIILTTTRLSETIKYSFWVFLREWLLKNSSYYSIPWMDSNFKDSARIWKFQGHKYCSLRSFQDYKLDKKF